MEPLRILVCVLLVFLIGACSGQHQVKNTDYKMEDGKQPEQGFASDKSPYVLGVGDEIAINVWRSDDLKRSIVIDPQGNIHLPLAGEIAAVGMTVSELEQAVILRLSRYLVNPVVDINVLSTQSQKYYILGEVKSPGMFRFKEKSSVLGGIIEAGGFNSTSADMKAVILLRKAQGVYRTQLLNFDISEIAQKSQSSFAAQLESGDIVYVPPRQITNFERFMQILNNIITPIVNLERGIVMWPDVKSVIQSGKTTSSGSGGAIVPP